MRLLALVLAALLFASCTQTGNRDTVRPSSALPDVTIGSQKPQAPQGRAYRSRLPRGLLEVSQGDYPPMLFAFEPVNGWGGHVGDNWVFVIAGRALRWNDSQMRPTPRGAVLVQTLHLSTGNSSYVTLYPGLRGPLRITDASGLHLLIRSTRTRQRVTFDVKSRNFM
jgi:hypothetical protein